MSETQPLVQRVDGGESAPRGSSHEEEDESSSEETWCQKYETVMRIALRPAFACCFFMTFAFYMVHYHVVWLNDDAQLTSWANKACYFASITSVVCSMSSTGEVLSKSTERIIGTVVGGTIGAIVGFFFRNWLALGLIVFLWVWFCNSFNHILGIVYAGKVAAFTFFIVLYPLYTSCYNDPMSDDCEESQQLTLAMGLAGTRISGIFLGVCLIGLFSLVIFPSSASDQAVKAMRNIVEKLEELHHQVWVGMEHPEQASEVRAEAQRLQDEIQVEAQRCTAALVHVDKERYCCSIHRFHCYCYAGCEGCGSCKTIFPHSQLKKLLSTAVTIARLLGAIGVSNHGFLDAKMVENVKAKHGDKLKHFKELSSKVFRSARHALAKHKSIKGFDHFMQTVKDGIAAVEESQAVMEQINEESIQTFNRLLDTSEKPVLVSGPHNDPQSAQATHLGRIYWNSFLYTINNVSGDIPNLMDSLCDFCEDYEPLKALYGSDEWHLFREKLNEDTDKLKKASSNNPMADATKAAGIERMKSTIDYGQNPDVIEEDAIG